MIRVIEFIFITNSKPKRLKLEKLSIYEKNHIYLRIIYLPDDNSRQHTLISIIELGPSKDAIKTQTAQSSFRKVTIIFRGSISFHIYDNVFPFSIIVW